MKRIIVIIVLIISLVTVSVFVVKATCDATGTIAADIITCTGASSSVNGDAGADTITIFDTLSGVVEGGVDADTITLEGTVNGIIYGDSMTSNVAGDDTIIINGTLNGAVVGDASISNVSAGNDTIIISGSITGNVIGDSVTTLTGIPGGNDNVILQDGANGGSDNSLTLIGVIGNDTLTLEFTVNSEADYLALTAMMAAANPDNGSIFWNGQTYVFFQFDSLVDNLFRSYLVTPVAPTLPLPEQVRRPIFRDGRINNNDPWASYAIYCPSGVITIYSIDAESNGSIAIQATPEEIAAAGIPTNANVLIDEGLGIRLYRLISGEFLSVSAPDAEGKVYYVLFSSCSVAGVIRTYTTP